MSRNWAFVIGINDYVPTNFRPLRYAKRDAESVRDFFVNEAQFEGVWLFTDDSPAQVLPNGSQISTQPTVGNLISLLEDRFEKSFLEEGDNCWFFFAGHGGQERNQDFLMPRDANPRAIERTAISVNYVRERLSRCGADNVILLLDACRTEGARDGGGIGAETQPGVITVSSCGPTEKSWEIEELGHGAFTYGLLEALRLSGERNCATVERLGQYLRDRVPNLCRQYGKFPEQRPRTAADPAEKLHFILQPSCATLADIAVLRTDAYEAEVSGNLELAEQIWIRVLVAAQGRDMKAIRALQRLERSRAGGGSTPVVPPKPQPKPEGARSPVGSQKPGFSEKPRFSAAGSGLELVRFRFETVQVDEFGSETERKILEAEQFIEDLGSGIVLEMVRIPGGEFWMGAVEGEEGASDDEYPRHQVMLPEFFLGKFVITQAQYQALIGENPSNFKGKDRPVEKVSWSDAQNFCLKLSHRTKREYRLPSEAEWEYVCRARTTTPFYFGPTITPNLANYDGSYAYGKGPEGAYRGETTRVGCFPANAFGLFDMHGNVLEWCEDKWQYSYEGAPADGSSWKSLQKSWGAEERVLRGGCWPSGASPGGCRSAARDRNSSDFFSDDVGFRVACFVPRK